MSASGTIYDLLESESLVRWNAVSPVGTPVTVSYAFATSTPVGANYPNFTAFSTAEKTATQAALAYISSFTNITFVETASQSAPLRFGNADLTGVGAGVTSYSYGPSGLIYADMMLSNTNPNIAGANFTPGDLSSPDLGGNAWQT